MNWLLKILKLVPYVVAGVNVLHSGQSNETKMQKTAELLNIANAGASTVLSADNAAISSAVNDETQAIINQIAANHHPATVT